ncbi:hypothetical protein AB3X55_08590 [Alphaproteobacteria bacterium LSUCC0719]
MKGGFIVDACVFSDELLDDRVRELINSDKKKILTSEGTRFHRELVNANRNFFKLAASKGRVEYVKSEHVIKKSCQLKELKRRRFKRTSARNHKEALIKSKDYDAIAIGITARASCLITKDNALSEDYPILKEIEAKLRCQFNNPNWKGIKPVAIKPCTTPAASIDRHLKAAKYRSTACDCDLKTSGGC